MELGKSVCGKSDTLSGEKRRPDGHHAVNPYSLVLSRIGNISALPESYIGSYPRNQCFGGVSEP